MSWAYDTGSIAKVFKTASSGTATNIFGIETGPVFAAEVHSIAMGTETSGTPRVEKIESVRYRVSYELQVAPHDQNQVVFTITGLVPKNPVNLPGGTLYVPQLVISGLNVASGAGSIDLTMQPATAALLRPTLLGSTALAVQSTLTGLSSQPWIAPTFEVHLFTFTTIQIRVTQVQIDVTSTRVGIDDLNNATSAIEQDLSGYIVGVSA